MHRNEIKDIPRCRNGVNDIRPRMVSYPPMIQHNRNSTPELQGKFASAYFNLSKRKISKLAKSTWLLRKARIQVTQNHRTIAV